MYMYKCTCTLLLVQWHSLIIVVSKGSKNVQIYHCTVTCSIPHYTGKIFMVEKFGEFLQL